MNYRLLVSLKALMLVMVVAVVASLVSVTAQEPAWSELTRGIPGRVL